MTVIDRIRGRASDFTDLRAVIDGPWRCTHGELWDRVDRLSQGLMKLGLRKGDVLVGWLPNAHEAIETELACLQTGAIWVTLNSQMTWAEVRDVVADTEPKIMVIGPVQYDAIDNADPKNPKSLKDALKVVTGEIDSILSYETLIASSPSERPQVEIEESDIARLRYTSGTTGTTKAAILSHRAYIASLENHCNELHALDTSDRVLHAAPLTHASGSYMFPILGAGGANVLLPKFDAEAALAAIERERVTTMFVVPTILQRLGAASAFNSSDFSSLRTVTYGGAPMALEKLTPIVEKLGTVLVQIYGLTEALHPVTTLKREEHYVGNPNLDSIGTPTKINEVKVVDGEGVTIEDGRVGELYVRGANVMDGYWKLPDETAKVLRDGWLATGDLGYCDANGYYRIVDRKKDVVISGGFNVYTSEVETLLTNHPAVAEVAVFGVPHDEWGEAVHAIVHPAPGASPTEVELLNHCRNALSRYKVPKRIIISETPLPKTNAGKILKKDLRAPYWRDQARQVH